MTGRALTPSDSEGCQTCVIHGATALVADDDRTTRELNTRVLERMGMNVLSCSDGQQAVDALATAKPQPHVAVLDVTMPSLNGFEVCHTIRSECDDLPVVFATGYIGDDLSRTLKTLHANALVSKPFRLEHLRHVVGSMLCPFIGNHLFGEQQLSA